VVTVVVADISEVVAVVVLADRDVGTVVEGVISEVDIAEVLAVVV
jgi:hypothetical protein